MCGGLSPHAVSPPDYCLTAAGREEIPTNGPTRSAREALGGRPGYGGGWQWVNLAPGRLGTHKTIAKFFFVKTKFFTAMAKAPVEPN